MLHLLREFAATLFKRGEVCTALGFYFVDALFKLLHTCSMSLCLIASLRSQHLILERRLPKLFLKFVPTLLQRSQVANMVAFHVADALFELFNGCLIGLRLFAGLGRDFVVPMGRLL